MGLKSYLNSEVFVHQKANRQVNPSNCFGIRGFFLAILFFVFCATLCFCQSPAYADTDVSGVISENSTWTKAEAPYVVTGDLTVAEGVTLTVEPGVVVKFDLSRRMTINGGLNAAGTVEQPIYFTSLRDDSIGGDTNGDGSATSPSWGDWYNLYFTTTSSNSLLDHVVIRHGGKDYYRGPPSYQTSLSIATSSITVSNSLIEESQLHGIYVADASPTITSNTIRNNGSRGLWLVNSSAVVSDNEILDNGGRAIFLDGRSYGATVSGNTLSGNGTDEISIGGTVSESMTLGILNGGSSYVVTDDLTVAEGVTLTVEPGVVIKFDLGRRMTINGGLNAAGAVDEPIYFTSIRDDSVGGDTNGDGAATSPSRGDWYNLYFTTTSSNSLLDHVVIRYGGKDYYRGPPSYQTSLSIATSSIIVSNSLIEESQLHGIYVAEASPTITSNTIRNNGSRGLWLVNSSAEISDNKINANGTGIFVSSSTVIITGNNIWGNRGYGIHLEQNSTAEITFNRISTNITNGIEVLSGANATATDNQIFMNREYGILNQTDNLVDATRNWWGDVDAGGPYQAVTNPDGTANQVSDLVDYNPYQTTIGTEFSYRNFSAGSGSVYGSLAAPVLVQGTISDEWDSSNLRPDRTMAYDAEAVILDYTGIDSSKRYKLRVSYFSADAGGTLQSLTDGYDTLIHDSISLPGSTPIQFEFLLPSSVYADGNLRLKFINDNLPSDRAVVPEVWLLEDHEASPPRLEVVAFNDIDGSGSLSLGDEFSFQFSKEMDSAKLVNGTTEANDRLVLAGGQIYGMINQSRWTTDNRTVIVSLTTGFTVAGTEEVTPTGLNDIFGNTAIGSANLTTLDTIAPEFSGIDWLNVDTNGSLSLGDQYIFRFNEAMQTAAIQNGTQDANLRLVPEGGLVYGNINTLSWSADGRDLTVSITEGFNVLGNEMVISDSLLTDVAGNVVVGSQRLPYDDTPPELLFITFDDLDGSGSVTLGDCYLFGFSEPMDVAALSDNTTDGNLNFFPAGKKYGLINRISWNEAFTQCVIKVSEGFTITGDEVVEPTSLVTDRGGNQVSNTGVLTLVDSVAPEVTEIQSNYTGTVGAVDDFRLTIHFAGTIDSAIEPVVALVSSGTLQPVVPTGGTWLSSLYPNDTYVTPDITLSAGMDGELQVNLSGARDNFGNEMAAADNLYNFILDATPPSSPLVTLSMPICDRVTLLWNDYVAPEGLAGFEIYKQTGSSFAIIDGLTRYAWLAKTARTHELTSLIPNTCYYVAVVAVDVTGNKISTVTPLEICRVNPDLTITEITWEPSGDLEAGQQVTFTATLRNDGTCATESSFLVDFKIDGESIGSQTVSQNLAAGESAQVNQAWTITTGEHTIEVVADSGETIAEADEENNSLSATLAQALDTTPPELIATEPVDGSAVQQAKQIVIILFDRDGVVDDAAVADSIMVTDGSGQVVSGTISETNDHFTFYPDFSPLPDDTYQVLLTAADEDGNVQNYSFSFTVDSLLPEMPQITGGTVTSGLLQVRPATNSSNSSTVTITGTREDGTSVWTNVLGLRVGAGQAFATIQAAVDVAQDGDTISIEPGTYLENVNLTKWIHIKGNSTDPDDIIIRSPGNVYSGYPPTFSFALSDPNPLSVPIRIEGIRVEPFAYSWNVGLSLQGLTGAGTVIFNRCKFIKTHSNTYPVGNLGYNTSTDTLVEFQNCLFERGYSHFVQMNSPNWSLSKCQLNTPYACTYCGYNPDPADYVTTETVGYGVNYGTWYFITSYAGKVVEMGSGDWSVDMFLPQGDNALEFWLEDSAANRSPSVWVDIMVDSQSPTITAIVPADESFINSAPVTIVIDFQEAESGLNLDSSTHMVTDSSQQEVSGSWSVAGDEQLIFTPTSALVDDIYTIEIQLIDNFSNQSELFQSQFTVDSTLPEVFAIDPVTTPSPISTQTLSGVKEAYAAILLNGEEIIDHTPETTWQYTVTLTEGENLFTFLARDQAENLSDAVNVTIIFDDTAPLAVDNLTLTDPGSGITAELDWHGYDEAVHGDIAAYRIYAETSGFTELAELSVRDTVAAGNFSCTVENLTRETTYFFAVLAVDLAGNVLTTVTPVVGVFTDTIAPEEVTNLKLSSFENRLVFAWDHSADSADDLVSYRIYFNGAATGTTLDSGLNTFEQTNLSPATAYPFRITAFDNDDHESAGVELTGITWLPNPANLTVSPYSGIIDLSWDGVEPSVYVDHYAIYVKETAFSTVAGMTPTLTVTGTSATISGLTNNVNYYCAVTAVNLSGGQNYEISSVATIPVADSVGPAITDERVDGVVLTDGFTLTKPATFSLSAGDPAGISRVEFSFDGMLEYIDYNGAPDYSCLWDVVAVADGNHTLTVTAFDTLGNSTEKNYNLLVALESPPAPSISRPVSGTSTNNPVVTVSGSATKNSEIILYRNGNEIGEPAPVNTLGNFSLLLSLNEGENRLQATARNRGGTGPLSSEIQIILDTNIPQRPANLSAQAKAGGLITLSWQAAPGIPVKGYHLYRSSATFTTTGTAQRVNTNLITGTSFNDLPAMDNTYYYRVTSVSLADNESLLSEEAVALSDSIMPRALNIDYTPEGNFDPQSGRIAPGVVQVHMSVSEPLMTIPFLGITPEAGVPVNVELNKISALEYAGFFVINENMPSGTAYVVFSARDEVGNRGTEIDSGLSILIDTDGPALIGLEIQPETPIRNDTGDPVTVSVTIGLDEALPEGEIPMLSYLLFGEGRQAIALENLIQTNPTGGEFQAWQGSFVLPADAGLLAAETFHFIYQGVDDLENLSDQILSPNLFQVYQGDLPPLDPPTGLSAESLPAGRIKLTWNAVEEAAGYQLFRQGPGESGLTSYQRLGTPLEFIDVPATDGLYTYALASIRQENSQEAISGPGNQEEAYSDSIPPEAPFELVLDLVPQGIRLEWQVPPYTETITYNIYRAAIAEITSVMGLTPLVGEIEPLSVIDPSPSPAEHCYVVSAVDEVGNESAPSNFFYLNFELLPVATLNVVQIDEESPIISWSHPAAASLAGYDLYSGSATSGSVKLNQTILTETSFTDSGYANDERLYTVVAVDDNQAESVGRTLTLPKVRAILNQESTIKRGVMNRLEYLVENFSDTLQENVRLNVDIGGYNHTTTAFSLAAGASETVLVIVGGYADLEAVSSLMTTIVITPNAGELVEIKCTDDIEVGEGMLVLQVLNEELTRGTNGTVRFTLENTGAEEIEITTSGTSEISCLLLDQDNNVLSSAGFSQTLGDGLVTLANGNTVARIPAGATFTSAPITLSIPVNAPDDVVVYLDIAKVYYHQGKEDQVLMNGLGSGHEVTLIDTSYYGEILNVTPEVSGGDEEITINGRAVERATGQPLAHVPLKLVISVNGFDREYEIYTDADGAFTHVFTPLTGEAGIYQVRAVHPELLDRPEQGQFIINRLSIIPSIINLNISRNYPQTIGVKAMTGAGTEVHNLRIVYEAEGQPAGDFLPAGVHITPDDPLPLVGGDQTATLNFTIWGDNTALETDSLVLKIKSDDKTEPWGTVVINTNFVDPIPALTFTPDHIETGVALDNGITETITLGNRGLAELRDVTLTLINPDGSPAPVWVKLASPAAQGNISVGEERPIGISFTSTAGISEGFYTFYLRVTAANHNTTDIGIYTAVTQSGSGNVLFKISDIYTGTLDENDELIQGLNGARIRVQNEAVLTIDQTLNSDQFGEAFFTELPTGSYKYRITANDHQEQIGRLWIKPGITVNEEVFLDYNLVTVEWEVNEITIEDRYAIVLNATFETDVPAAVVVTEPASVTLPEMQAGEVFQGEFTLTNYGLIRAEKVAITLPDDPNFRYEVIGGLPETLGAKERITVPYRVTCLISPDQAEGDASGGGCTSSVKCSDIVYAYVCANGHWSTEYIHYCWVTEHCSSSDGDGGDGSTDPSDPTTWGVQGLFINSDDSGSSSSPSAKPISGLKCFPDPDKKECDNDPCAAGCDRETRRNNTQDVGSVVNTVLREYNDRVTDLSVKVPGGRMVVDRFFSDNGWQQRHRQQQLSFTYDFAICVNNLPDAQCLEYTTLRSVIKGGVAYKRSALEDVFVNESFRITRESPSSTAPAASTWRWEDKYGNWKLYQGSLLTAYGNHNGELGRFVYDDDYRVIGQADRTGCQVLWYEYDQNDRLVAVHDGAGRRVAYSYTNGLLTKVTDVLANETIYEYDDNGRLVRKVTATGKESNITYDDYGNVASVLDSQGNGYFFEFDYDDFKKESYALIRSSEGKVKEVWYDKDFETKKVAINGRTTQKILKDGRNLIITDEQGNITRKEYDEWDNLTKIIHPDGTFASYEYEHTFNQKIKETDERGVVTEYLYDALGNLSKKIEAKESTGEKITEYTYDTDDNRLTIKTVADAKTAEALTTMAYDAYGNLTASTDPEGNITRFTHDAMGNVLTREDANGKVFSYAYDAAGHLVTITDPLANLIQMNYDAAGDKASETDANGNQQIFAYNEHDKLITSTDAAGNITRFVYDADNRLVQRIDPEEKSIRYEYDNSGRMTKTVDGNGNEIAWEYDNYQTSTCSTCAGGGQLEQPKRIIYPTFIKELTYDVRGRKTREKDILNDFEDYTTVFSYDAVGNLILKTDKEGKQTSYAYDDLNRLIKVVDSDGGQTLYVYDDRNNLIALTDANGRQTQFVYDRNNRLLKEIRPLGAETFYQYDGVGNLVEKIDAEDHKTEYLYDAAGRLSETRYYAASAQSGPEKTVLFSYDAVGNLKAYDDAVIAATYDYDAANRKIAETVDYGAFSLSNAMTYYKNGSKKSFSGPDGITYSYSYDDNNQLLGIEIPDIGLITNNAYNWTRPTKTTLPGGTTREYAYDQLMRLKELSVKDPGQNPQLDYFYNYDGMDNIIEKQTGHGDYAYEYDELYRLTDADQPAESESFAYDAVGNRLSANATVSDWSYNANNELLGYDEIAYSYDANGSLIQKTDGAQVTDYVYNLENRLARVEKDGVLSAAYYYDPFGRRLWKEVDGIQTCFHYTDEGLIGEYDATGTEIKIYVWRPHSTWSTDPLFMKEDGQYYFYHNDHLGTPQKMTAVNGAVVWSARYESFGKAEIDAGAVIENNLRFPGQYFDTETGLNYNYYRYYDPMTGRYLTPDPIGLVGMDPNIYGYVLNNPINYVDPQGLYRDIGGGFGLTLAVVSVSVSVTTDTCCDEQNNKHLRTIQSVTVGFELGLGLKGSGGSNASLSDDKVAKKCPKNYDDLGYYSEDSGVWGALIIGRSYSKTNGTGWKVGFGGGWTVYSGSSNTILNDVIVGKCCSQ